MAIKRTLAITLILLLVLLQCACSSSGDIIISKYPGTSVSTAATAAATVPVTEATHAHNFGDATCSQPQTCTVCGATTGSPAGHDFVDGKCTVCGAEDPNFQSEVMVWIPTKGGKKYHTRPECSNMIDPDKVTLSEAEALGFTPCKRCH